MTRLMNKDFVPYDLALELKELGFDEPSISYYKNDQFSYGLELVTNSEMRNVNNEINDYISAPTFSQVLRWFRETHKLPSWVYTSNNKEWWYSVLKNGSMIVRDYKPFPSFEEAEIACLKKLIEIVKQ